MDAHDVIETVPASNWTPPPISERALEDGRVVVLPDLAFEIRPDERDLLRADAGGAGRKNISLDPRTGALGGTELAGEPRARLAGMIGRFGQQAEALVQALFPHYRGALTRARTSFRPAEIAGRAYTPRHDDRLLHVDAFPTRPLHGARILRVFANVAPDGTPRQWRVGEPFPDFAQRFLPRLRRPMPGQAWAMARLGLTKGVRSAHDHLMLQLHDAAKLDAAYQDSAPRADVSFAAGSVWMCFTDSVLHAALSGRCALEQTFHLPADAMADPGKSPLRVLERLTGRTLA